MTSWNNVCETNDPYMQWIEYSKLGNVREATSLRHGCTHIADWQSTRVTLKLIVDDDFYQVNHFMCNGKQ